MYIDYLGSAANDSSQGYSVPLKIRDLAALCSHNHYVKANAVILLLMMLKVLNLGRSTCSDLTMLH